MDRKKFFRYFISGLLAVAMVAVASLTHEREVIFPELVALSVGALIIDKQVWVVSRWQLVVILTLGAVAGLCISRYSALGFALNLVLAFSFAAFCLLIFRSTLNPAISACMLPVLLHTQSWVYPLAVFVLSLALVLVQVLLERLNLRQPIVLERNSEPLRPQLKRWFGLIISVLALALVAHFSGFKHMVLPPLVVAFTEIVNSHAGFRNRPTQIFIMLVVAVLIGTGFQLFGFYHLHLPQSVVALCVVISLFVMFEITGKFFAPAGALAFIPMVLPYRSLFWLPLQASAGAAIFIAIALLGFMRCYRWDRARLIYCLTPSSLRGFINRKRTV